MPREQFRLVTREQFLAWLIRRHVAVTVEGHFEAVRCACRDVNCHGWRLVPRVEGEAPILSCAHSFGEKCGACQGVAG